MANRNEIEATITLNRDQIEQILKGMTFVDRHAAMVDKWGEACRKVDAAKILSCSVTKINSMIEDGRIRLACGGDRIDVRSIADYIETGKAADHAARMKRKGYKTFA